MFHELKRFATFDEKTRKNVLKIATAAIEGEKRIDFELGIGEFVELRKALRKLGVWGLEEPEYIGEGEERFLNVKFSIDIEKQLRNAKIV